jgi:hypothetical protein
LERDPYEYVIVIPEEPSPKQRKAKVTHEASLVKPL